MDFSHPYRALTPTLDGPVLRALSRADVPMTRRQVADVVGDASEAGVRKVLARLAEQGMVIEQRIGSSYTYVANRDHLLWPAVDVVLTVRSRLDDKIRELVSAWAVAPVSVELFGSVVTGKSDEASDIDILVGRPTFEGGLEPTWDHQIEELVDAVERWTGNPCHIVQVGPEELAKMIADGEAILSAPRTALVGVSLGSARPETAAPLGTRPASHAPLSPGVRQIVERTLEAARRAQGTTG